VFVDVLVEGGGAVSAGLRVFVGTEVFVLVGVSVNVLVGVMVKVSVNSDVGVSVTVDVGLEVRVGVGLGFLTGGNTMGEGVPAVRGIISSRIALCLRTSA
jgi:hypothetical protein